MRKERALLGHVKVDTGMLLIADPLYIDQHWETDSVDYGIQFWGEGEEDVKTYLTQEGFNVSNDQNIYRIVLLDAQVQADVSEKITQYAQEIGKVVRVTGFNHDSISEITDAIRSGEQGGQVLGDSGLAFASGLGDGVYSVYATYADFGTLGERITKVEIELISDDE